jgi:ribosomal protein S18 acetylase RimI-like enzyme
MTGYRTQWRGPFGHSELNGLHAEAFGTPVGDHDWETRVRRHSLGWVCAYGTDDRLVGFVNVAWDGAHHAFLLDTSVDAALRRQGVGAALVAEAAGRARAAGCTWLHVDFDGEAVGRFYFEGCGFRPTAAGLLALAPVETM